jgi:hypothetical protein
MTKVMAINFNKITQNWERILIWNALPVITGEAEDISYEFL